MFNARTGLDDIKKVIANAELQNVIIIRLEEHRIILHQDNSIDYKAYLNGWTLVTTSVWNNTENAILCGIDLLTSQYAYKPLKNIRSINQRTIVPTFQRTIVGIHI